MLTLSLFDGGGEVFRVSNPGNDVVNEYRITRQGLEFRTRNPGISVWKIVNRADLEMHVVLRTPVAKWMERRKPDLLDSNKTK